MDFETRAIHEGQEPDPATGAVTVPIYQTSTYVQEAVGEHKGYDYSRIANPTRTRARDLPRLARGRRARVRVLVRASARRRRSCTSSSPATAIVAVNDVYGGVYRHVLAGLRAEGLRVRVRRRRRVDANSPTHLDERTRLVWLETPTNPLLNVVDIRAAADAAHAVGAVVVVDNTFATPYLQRPLELGADIVVHSTTKYLGGHSDVVGGFVATNDPTIAERLAFLQNSLGAVPGPFDCVARPARDQDARRPHAPALRERPRGRRVPRRPPGGRARPLPRPRRPSRPRARRAADARLRRDGLVPRGECRGRPPRWSRGRRSGSSPRASAASRA